MTNDTNLLRLIKPVVGGFVRTPDDYGIGKLVEVGTGRGRVLFRQSTISVEEKEYPLNKISRFYLYPQTRIYWLEKETNVWHSGRVVEYSNDPDSKALVYTIRFPNKSERYIFESELETRSLLPNPDPVDALAEGWSETQFFFDRRKATLNVLVHSRAADHGLTGLLSSSVELLPHQVEVVRRVLTDPVQRYLLADEVGLGKTIEAGCIIRQILLDDPDAIVSIVTPPTLVKQWERELAEKFGSKHFSGRLSVLSFERLFEIDESKLNTLVIDEAHHLLESGSSVSFFESPTYRQLTKLAHASRRLLVLSATPVFGDETAMLGLLHLLDPVVHRLEDRQSFHEKMVRRQEYGRLLMALDPAAKPFILKRLGNQLLQEFPGDEVVAANVQTLLAPPTADPLELGNNIRQLKRHMAETYRLHHRLLRTRRKDLEGWELQPRNGILKTTALHDSYFKDVFNYLEEWRYQSLVSLQNRKESPDFGVLKSLFARRYKALIQSTGQSPEDLSEEIKAQWQDVVSQKEPTFTDEDTIIKNLQNIIETADSGQWVGLVIDAIRSIKLSSPGAPKILAFSSSTGFAKKLTKCLQDKFKDDDIVRVVYGMSSTEIDEALNVFKNTKHPSILVCDDSGEEGLNLHFADAIVQIDLPLAPAKIEQRIGRVDRFGRHATSIQNVIILPLDDTENPWFAWYELLKSSFDIFNNSISDVQFLLETLQLRLDLALYEQGWEGLKNSVSWVTEELGKERIRLDEQYALDQLAMFESENKFAFTDFEMADDKANYHEMDRWLVETLNLKQDYEPHHSKIFRLSWTKQTLMPKNPWENVFNSTLEQRWTYDRVTAVNCPGVSVVRPGALLFDAVQQHLLWDDRGTSFSTWRVDARWDTTTKAEWTGFQLVYMVEFDINEVIKILNLKMESPPISVIKRRVDTLFSPWIETLILDTSFNEVTDKLVLEILKTPYRATIACRDINLSSHNEVTFSLIPRSKFHDLCFGVRQKSEQLIWRSKRFTKAVKEAIKAAEQELTINNLQLERRDEALTRLEGVNDATIRIELAINNAVMKAVVKPVVKLDSMGFFVISDKTPEIEASIDK